MIVGNLGRDDPEKDEALSFPYRSRITSLSSSKELETHSMSRAYAREGAA